LYSPYGNLDLTPERESSTVEAGGLGTIYWIKTDVKYHYFFTGKEQNPFGF
jgi:hypothetical protein